MGLGTFQLQGDCQMAATAEVGAALRRAREHYTRKNPGSLEQFEKACMVFPGGSTRTSLFYEPFPLTMVRGAGAHLWDTDGHEYVDFLGEYTAGLFGHTDPKIGEAIRSAFDSGIDLGAHNLHEATLGRLIQARFPSMELLRFTNSGTEANLMAISAARAITKRCKILVFDGSYHGGVFSFAGGGNVINAPYEFLVAEYNDVEQTLGLLDANANELAAVLIEPMMGAGGCIPAERQFLQALRDRTLEHGILLVFDEVMTSRLWPGGLQEMHGIRPDVTTLGKYIGGGMSCGAFGGRADIMSHFDVRREGGFPHAGTFNNNVLTMAAGVAGMELFTAESTKDLNARGEQLRRRLNDLARGKGANMQFTGIGSMMNMHLRRAPIRNASDVAASDLSLRQLLFLELVGAGIWCGCQGMFVLSLPSTEADCDALIAGVAGVIDAHSPLLVG